MGEWFVYEVNGNGYKDTVVTALKREMVQEVMLLPLEPCFMLPKIFIILCSKIGHLSTSGGWCLVATHVFKIVIMC